MREILFRGKSIDLDKWVYGFYAGENCKYPWSPSIKQANIIQEGSGLWFEVAPETVGQFTGLTDKNGKKIFEGDILKYYDTVHKVVFCTVNGSAFYGIERRDRGEIWAFNYMTTACDGEVIGNIHDNPKLLERE